MKTLSHILLVILALSLAVRLDAQEGKELSEVVTELRDSRDAVNKLDSPFGLV